MARGVMEHDENSVVRIMIELLGTRGERGSTHKGKNDKL